MLCSSHNFYMNLTNNTILITGGGSGIGRALAESFHHLGNQVIITGRNQKKLDETTAANAGMKSLVADMSDPGSLHSLADQNTKSNPNHKALDNKAGIMLIENLLDAKQSLADSEATINTNLFAPIRLTAALLPVLKTQPRSVIMNVSSGLAFVPMAITPTYCATKAAIHSYTQALRYQLKDTAVEVLELIPPYVATTLMGEHGLKDPQAMPLGEYISEVMEILKTEPTPSEICVKRVYPLRFASDNGQAKYDEMFKGFNDAMAAAFATANH